MFGQRILRQIYSFTRVIDDYNSLVVASPTPSNSVHAGSTYAIIPHHVTLNAAISPPDPKKWAAIEADYKTYIAKILSLGGYCDEEVTAAVPVIIRLEQRLAGVSLSKIEEIERAVTLYSAFTFADANAKYPLTVGAVLDSYGLDITDNVPGPLNKIGFYDFAYFDKAEALVASTPVDDFKAFLSYRLLHNAAPHLSPEYHTANWEFFGKKISGQKTEPASEKFCATQADAVFGEILGKYYLEAVWSDETATGADAMVRALFASFQSGIEKSDWLDEQTRANAKTKLSKFIHLLGGPENPKLYPDVDLDPASYLANRWAVSQQDVADNIKLLGTTVDKTVWGMTAQTINAYYDPSVNEIVFPAAILQSPFFNADFDAAQNFGAIGAVIGHEITHGFDNSGRNYDGNGNLN
ncbi:hypothetical protein As57867_019869, partial [Aphanomyces stellatus]